VTPSLRGGWTSLARLHGPPTFGARGVPPLKIDDTYPSLYCPMSGHAVFFKHFSLLSTPQFVSLKMALFGPDVAFLLPQNPFHPWVLPWAPTRLSLSVPWNFFFDSVLIPSLISVEGIVCIPSSTTRCAVCSQSPLRSSLFPLVSCCCEPCRPLFPLTFPLFS